MNIRPATPDDLDAIDKLTAQSDALDDHVLTGRSRRKGSTRHSRPRAYILGLMQDPNAGVIVAESDGQIVGLVEFEQSLLSKRPGAVWGGRVVVQRLVVDEAHRREGIGRVLMEYVYHWAQERKLKEIALTVFEFNTAAIRFYEALGYTTFYRQMILTVHKSRSRRG